MNPSILIVERATAPNSRKKKQSGASMIELLVSLLIFSFGMLGLAGLQVRSLSMSQSSLYRSQATALTDDILDRMRADRDNALAGQWTTALTNASSSIATTPLAKSDMKDWKATVEALLPDGKASVAVGSGTVTVTLQWDDTRGREAAQSWTTVSRL
jgi:type IV pilus assembly protein PilV